MLDASTIATLCEPFFATRPGVKAAFLFGSTARGRATAASDIDIAVVGRGVDIFELSSALSPALEGREVDMVEMTLDSPIPLLRAILSEGERIYERAPGDAGEFASRARTVLELDGPGYDLQIRAFMARVARQGVGG